MAAWSEPLDVVVRGGAVAAGHGAVRADVGIREGKIALLAPDLSGVPAAQTVEATGKLVLPGVIDVHNHPVYDDDMLAVTRGAVFGGVTTVIPFTGPLRAWGMPEQSLAEVIKWTAETWAQVSLIDFGLHVAVSRQDDPVRDIPAAIALGVTSFKFYMAYLRRGMMVEDDLLAAAFDVIARHGGTAMVHAENGRGIDYLESKLAEARPVEDGAYLQAHTDLLEAEAVLRAIALADAVRCPLYIAHLSAREGLEVAQLVRDRLAMPLYLETLPHFLLLTNDEVLRRGPLAKIGPPLRNRHDSEALWRGLQQGAIDVVATDHAAYTMARKRDCAHILDAKFGLPGIEQLLPLLYSEGVGKERLSLGRLVQVLCENPARIFGLYPQKGVLAPGADADLVVFDPAVRWRLGAENLHTNCDYSLYEGWELQGRVELVMQRGEILLAAGQLRATPGRGRFLPVKPR